MATSDRGPTNLEIGIRSSEFTKRPTTRTLLGALVSVDNY